MALGGHRYLKFTLDFGGLCNERFKKNWQNVCEMNKCSLYLNRSIDLYYVSEVKKSKKSPGATNGKRL